MDVSRVGGYDIFLRQSAAGTYGALNASLKDVEIVVEEDEPKVKSIDCSMNVRGGNLDLFG